MLEHWGHLCETYEGAGAANLYFDRKSWMEHFNSHPEIYCILPKNTFLRKGKLIHINFTTYIILIPKLQNSSKSGITINSP